MLNHNQTESYLKFLFDILKSGDTQKAKQLFNNMKQKLSKNSMVETFTLLLSVYDEEKKNGVDTVIYNKDSLQELLDVYEKVKFFLRRYDFDVYDIETAIEMKQFLSDNKISKHLLKCVIENSIINHAKVKKKLAEQFGVEI